MGIFDIFKSGAKDKKERNPAAKWADRIEKRAQNLDRQEAIQALSDMESAEAVVALLRRFTFYIDPSITDQEEKDSAFRGILRAGKAAIDPVSTFAAKAESLAWPMKIMKELLDEQAYTEVLLEWLSRWDTEYAKFTDPKLDLLKELEERTHPGIREAVERFLEDVNEPARFHAVVTLCAHGDEASAPALAKLLGEEESLRVRTKIAEGLASRAWTVPEDEREAVRNALPPAFALEASGRITKR